MGNDTRDAVGVDISKAHLDVHRLNTGEAAQFGNDAAGFEALAAWIGSSADEVVYESTGPWHRAFEEALVERLPLTRVNALRARRFAQAMGQEAKTDKADAQVLARMGAALPLRRVAPRSATRRDLDELHTARDGLVKDRTAARNRQRQACHRLLKRQLKIGSTRPSGSSWRWDAEIARLIADDEELSRGVEVLTSIPGIARVTASGLLAEMPELGHLDAKAAASLAGVAPITRESGQWKGRSFIHGGRARVRRMLYMAALSASQAQSGSGAQVPGTDHAGQTAEGRADGGHAQAGGAGQHAAGAGPDVVARRRADGGVNPGRDVRLPRRTGRRAQPRSGAASRHRASVQTATPEKRADPRFEVVLISLDSPRAGIRCTPMDWMPSVNQIRLRGRDESTDLRTRWGARRRKAGQ